MKPYYMENTPAAPVTVPPQSSAPILPPQAAPKAVPRLPFTADTRDRVILPLLWVWCALGWDLFLFLFWRAASLGLGMTLLLLAFLALTWVYLGPPKTVPTRLLLLCNTVLILTFGLGSDFLLRGWNILLLFVLLPLQLYGWTGMERIPWYLPRMLLQRFLAFFPALGRGMGAFGPLFARRKEQEGAPHSRRWLWVLLGLGVAVILLVVLFPLLLSADQFFSQTVGGWVRWLTRAAKDGVVRLLLGALVVPLLFSLFYCLRHPERAPLPAVKELKWQWEPAMWLTVAAVLDCLYVLFLGIQSAALFGGADYLSQAGISYAEYARSGFFQLVGVVFLNLSVLLLAVQLCRREGTLWRGVQIAGTVLLLESAILLVSAAWRMTLYVMAYGLSFKRFVTYWGMVMAAILLAAALLKLWKPSFSFFRILLAGGLAGYLLLNLSAPSCLIARCNVNAYQRGYLEDIDASYLAGLSYDALAPLSDLPPSLPVQDMYGPSPRTLEDLIADTRQYAANDCHDLRSWSLSAWLASRKG